MAQISDIVATIVEYNNRINTLYENYVKKIDGYVKDFNAAVADAEHKSKEWLAKKTGKISKSINDCIEGFNNTIKNILESLETWYNNAINEIKLNIAKATLAKVGQDLPADSALVTAAINAIPHPSLSSLINIPELQVPQLMYL